tara:strand:+ start:322 stop:873 length:552 start_codon:yes stop_codon:yes gene_type:complete
MPTVIIRPDAISSSSGFSDSGSTLLGKINDNNVNTSSSQNNTSASIVCSFGNDSAYSGATINSVTFSIIANLGARAEEATVDFVLASLETNVQSGSIGIEGAEPATFSGSALTSAVNTSTKVDGLTATITPDSGGIVLYEVFITVDYTAASGYGHKVGTVAAASISKVNTVATASIGKINTVD